MSLATNRVGGAVGRTFRSLHVRNYRLYFIAQTISMSGTWMQSVAQGWLVLHLVGGARPGRAAVMLSITVALQFGPVLVLGPWGGLIADRTDKRKLLLATQTAMMVLATVLGLLTFTGTVRLWMVFVIAALMGVTNSLDNPSRQSFVFEMVGPGDLANAVGLNSVIINGSRVVGPALAGILIARVGLTPCFLGNAASFLFVIGALLLMRPAELHRGRPVSRKSGQLRAGFSHAWHAPELRLPLVIMAVVGTLGYNFSVLMPLMARYAFHRGGGTYAALATAMGVGALAGGLFAAARARPNTRLLVVSTTAFGVLSVAAAFAPTLPLEIGALLVMGAFSVLFVSTTNSLLQLNAEPAMRGRVMAIWAMVFLGSTPIGSLFAGVIAGRYGPRVAFAAGGVVTVLTGVGASATVRRRRLRRAARAAAASTVATRPAHAQVCLPNDPEPDDALDDLAAGRRDPPLPAGALPNPQPH
jgi:MFS family permease